MQGYLFARPAPADEALVWLRQPERLFHARRPADVTRPACAGLHACEPADAGAGCGIT
jgi:hypothetical protein